MQPENTPTTTEPLRRPGRKRLTERDERILAATIEVLADTSYGALALERVAERAGVSKATIYRWYKSKENLVGEALSWHLKPEETPRSQSVRDDVRAAIDVTIRNYSTPLAGVVVPALAAEIARDPELRSVFLTKFLGPRRAVARSVLERAIAAGDLPEDLDVELIMDMWAGAIFYRTLMSGTPISPAFSEQFVELLFDGRLPRAHTR